MSNDEQVLLIVFAAVTALFLAVVLATALTFATLSQGKRDGKAAAGRCRAMVTRDSLLTVLEPRGANRPTGKPSAVTYCARFGDRLVLRINDSVAVVPRDQLKVIVLAK